MITKTNVMNLTIHCINTVRENKVNQDGQQVSHSSWLVNKLREISGFTEVIDNTRESVLLQHIAIKITQNKNLSVFG